MLDEECRRELRCTERLLPNQPAEEGQVRGDALDLGFGQRIFQALDRRGPRRAVGDQLREQGVVPDSDLVSRFDAGVDADPVRQDEPLEAARTGGETSRILRVEPGLDCVTRRSRCQVDPLAHGDAELELDDIEAGDELGDGMLDLDQSVQLEEEHLLAVDQELGGAGARYPIAVAKATAAAWIPACADDAKPGAGPLRPVSGGAVESSNRAVPGP